MVASLILLLALLIDLTLGEPPAVIHPVVWMGKMISFITQGRNTGSRLVQFLHGLFAVILTAGVFTAPVYFGLAYLKNLNIAAYVIIAGVALKTTFSLNGLRLAALKVKNLLEEDKLNDARFELRALVGRDTNKLNKSQVVSAVVESVAENSCDSFFAPLFYFLIFGVTGAVAYRAVNTLDSMIGHHGEFEYLGRFTAKLDSLMNLVPARFAALIIVLSSWVYHKKASDSWRIVLRDCKKTESPNAGWTMSAIAGALGVQLEKVGYYRLGDNKNSLSTGTIDVSLRIVMTACFIWCLLIVSSQVIYHVTA